MNRRTNILVVDDEPGVLALMMDLFLARGYECHVAKDAKEAITLFQDYHSEVVISDINMPGMNGLELTKIVLEDKPQTAVILMTGNGDVDLAIQALRLGASDYLLKPFDLKTVETSLRRAISKNQALQDKEQELVDLKHGLLESVNSRNAAAAKTMEAFCRTLEMRDIETFSHMERVSAYSCCLARNMGLNTEEQEVVRIGSLLHDIGKVVVPDRILLKADVLTEQERVLMRKHVDAGYRIVSGIPGLEKAAEMVLHHHEWFGGDGYPLGLQGENICMGARIFSVADTYDAITSNRPYRLGRSDAIARAEIQKHSGRQFDPHAVEVFLAISKEEWQQVAMSKKEDALAVG